MNKVLNQIISKESPRPSLEVALTKVVNDSAIGFTKIPERLHLFEQSEKIGKEMLSKYDQFLVIGIGGSSMGSRALVEISNAKNMHFLDNVDAAEFEKVWKRLTENSHYADSKAALAKVGFLVVSKSGSTIEILWNYSLLDSLMKELGLNLASQSYFVTEQTQNPIANLAHENKRPVLEVPADVGGRFSVLTPVGLVVAQLCGFSLSELRAGAASALNEKSEILNMSELFLKSFQRNEFITLFWFYNSNYQWFGAWLQQLWAESLGKMSDLHGKEAPAFSTPMTAIGACDQHSILQQVAHGPKNKFVMFFCFHSVENSRFNLKNVSFASLQKAQGRNYGELISCQAQATEEALKQNSVSTHFVNVNDQNLSFTMGYLFMYFQLIVAALGVHENINPFDQPGVALGKELALKKLKL